MAIESTTSDAQGRNYIMLPWDCKHWGHNSISRENMVETRCCRHLKRAFNRETFRVEDLPNRSEIHVSHMGSATQWVPCQRHSVRMVCRAGERARAGSRGRESGSQTCTGQQDSSAGKSTGYKLDNLRSNLQPTEEGQNQLPESILWPHTWGGTHTPPTLILIKINFKMNRNLHIYTNFNLHVWYHTCNLHTHPCILTSFINTQIFSKPHPPTFHWEQAKF